MNGVRPSGSSLKNDYETVAVVYNVTRFTNRKKSVKIQLLIITVLAMAMLSTSAASESKIELSCIARIQNSVGIGTNITLTLTDGTSKTGQLLSVSNKFEQVNIGWYESDGAHEFSATEVDLLTIDYREKGKIRRGFVVGGFLIGGLLGQILEYNVIDPGGQTQSPFHEITHRGSFWGAIGGAVIGSLISALIPTDKRIKCGK